MCRKLDAFNSASIYNGAKATATPIRLCLDIKKGATLLVAPVSVRRVVAAIQYMKLNDTTARLLGYESLSLCQRDWLKRFRPVNDDQLVKVFLFQ